MWDLQNKVNSLTDARTLYDPETASSSGATDVPSTPSTFPSPRTMPCRDSRLPHDTRNVVGTSENVFGKNLASFSQELRLDATETTRRRESEMKRELLNTSIPVLHFRSGGGMLKSYWWNLLSQWCDGSSETSDFGNAC